jgi:hypothetical protein
MPPDFLNFALPNGRKPHEKKTATSHSTQPHKITKIHGSLGEIVTLHGEQRVDNEEQRDLD